MIRFTGQLEGAIRTSVTRYIKLIDPLRVSGACKVNHVMKTTTPSLWAGIFTRLDS